MASQHSSTHARLDRPSQRPHAPSLLVKTDEKLVLLDGRMFQLVPDSKTGWRVIDVATGASSWFRLAAHPAGGYVVREAGDRTAESVGAAWVWGCGQTSRSALPPRPSLH